MGKEDQETLNVQVGLTSSLAASSLFVMRGGSALPFQATHKPGQSGSP